MFRLCVFILLCAITFRAAWCHNYFATYFFGAGAVYHLWRLIREWCEGVSRP
jgi:hypothetical protein